jgi:hypothetical protein
MKSNIRDVSKYLEEFKKIREKSKYKAGNIYSSEMEQLYNLSVRKDRLDIAMLCWNSYEFGFIAGLHYAKNQQKKR